MPHKKLGQFFATSICGNDILSSALYVSGIAIVFAGVYAPLVLLGIAAVLYLYKAIYTEVVEALPINGGAYNCLLNGTSKTVAATAGITTLLSYVATAVISAKIGVEYMHTIFPQLPVIPATIALLGVFALLIIAGIKDSAKVASGIFGFHLISLTLFLILGGMFYLFRDSYFQLNLAHTHDLITSSGGIRNIIYLAFSASLLGVSGFESSANFVEEQAPGVFRKTLRNMLLGVAIFNPLIALVVLNALPFEAIASAKDFLLAEAAQTIGGTIFKYVIVVDAFLVLSGAVLTAYVGVSGLVSRMSADNCLPLFFAKQNKRGSFPRIAIGFFLLCTSILLVTQGELLSLAGVYTIAFLSVMTLFALGNLILKETRTELKRTYRAPLYMVIPAFLATTIGIAGNIRIDPDNLKFFEIYFIPAFVIVLLVIYKDKIVKFALRISQNLLKLNQLIHRYFDQMIKDEFVVFISNVSRLYEILDYINRNETGWNITLVHCPADNGTDHTSSVKEIEETLGHLRKANVFPHLKIAILPKQEPFSPKLVDKVAEERGVAKNKVFIGSLHDYHPFDYADFGGVRIIF